MRYLLIGFLLSTHLFAGENLKVSQNGTLSFSENASFYSTKSVTLNKILTKKNIAYFEKGRLIRRVLRDINCPVQLKNAVFSPEIASDPELAAYIVGTLAAYDDVALSQLSLRPWAEKAAFALLTDADLATRAIPAVKPGSHNQIHSGGSTFVSPQLGSDRFNIFDFLHHINLSRGLKDQAIILLTLKGFQMEEGLTFFRGSWSFGGLEALSKIVSDYDRQAEAEIKLRIWSAYRELLGRELQKFPSDSDVHRSFIEALNIADGRLEQMNKSLRVCSGNFEVEPLDSK